MKKKSEIPTEIKLSLLVSLVFIILATGTIFYHYIEQWTWLDSLYFSVITLTTVGFGDLTPTTSLSKIFTIGYIIFGIGIIFSFINVIAKREFHRKRR